MMKLLKSFHSKLLATTVLLGVCVLSGSAIAATNNESSNSDIGARWLAAVTAAVTVAARSCRW